MLLVDITSRSVWYRFYRSIYFDKMSHDSFICILQDDNVLLICRYLKKVIEDCTSSEDTLKLLRVSTNTLFFASRSPFLAHLSIGGV